MSYHPRIESSEYATLCTTRTRNSELWLINNEKLESATLGYLAKYSHRYDVKLYAFALEGSHIHTAAHYPKMNQSAFNRDLNSSIARALSRHQPLYPGGRLWARRYSSEFLPGDADIEEYFFYIVLQPIKDGLVDRLSEYPGYNCFHDAVNEITRSYEVINWRAYYENKRWNPEARIDDFKEVITLKYERLPGYESLGKKEYRTMMYQKLEERRIALIKERNGRKSLGAPLLKRKRPGERAKNPKISTINSHRPRVLSVSDERRHQCKNWYFHTVIEYREASKAFRNGDLSAVFPPGTYKPPPSSYPVSLVG